MPARSLTSDIEGLTKASPVSRRNFFMSASAAAAAGYTLAAGPVRAQAITMRALLLSFTGSVQVLLLDILFKRFTNLFGFAAGLKAEKVGDRRKSGVG